MVIRKQVLPEVARLASWDIWIALTVRLVPRSRAIQGETSQWALLKKLLRLFWSVTNGNGKNIWFLMTKLLLQYWLTDEANTLSKSENLFEFKLVFTLTDNFEHFKNQIMRVSTWRDLGCSNFFVSFKFKLS